MSKPFVLSEAVSIGLHSMVIIARSDHQINVLEIADKTNTSKNHIAKIMQILVKKGFLASTRGPAGGFKLRKKPEEIKLLDVFESIEGKMEITECGMGYEKCPFDQCILGNFCRRITVEFKEFLEGHSLKDYMDK
jgi:Rrf2 family protein